MQKHHILKELRQATKFSRRELADILDISSKTVESYEYGVNTEPPIKYIEALFTLAGYNKDAFHLMILSDNSFNLANYKEYKLCKFSHSINLLSYFSNKTLKEIEDFLILLGVYDNDQLEHHLYELANINTLYLQHVHMTEAPFSALAYTPEQTQHIVTHFGSKIVLGLNYFKPSEFGITIEECVLHNCDNDTIKSIIALEKSGKPLTKNSVKESGLFGVASLFGELTPDRYKNLRRIEKLQENAQFEELIILWEKVSDDTLKDEIIEKLRASLEQSIKDGEDILRIAATQESLSSDSETP